jgi:PD-(D/E)XK nuclease superfamily
VDPIVEKRVLLEPKSVEALLPVRAKQVLTYNRLANLHFQWFQAVTVRFAKTTPLASGPNTVTQNTAIATVMTTIAKAWA